MYRHGVRTFVWLEWGPAVKEIMVWAMREDLEVAFDAIGGCWKRHVMERMFKEEDSNNHMKKKIW